MRWPAAVASFVNANEAAFRALDQYVDLPAAERDKPLTEMFFNRVATEIEAGVCVIHQQHPFDRLRALDDSNHDNRHRRQGDDRVVRLSSQKLAQGRVWRLLLWGRSVEIRVILDTSVAIYGESAYDYGREVRDGPIFEAANRVCRVLLDAPPAGLHEKVYSDAEWNEKGSRRHYAFYETEREDGRVLPPAAVPLLETLQQFFIFYPVDGIWDWVGDEESSVRPIPDVVFQHLSGDETVVRVADLLQANAAAAGGDAMLTAKTLGLGHIGDGYVSAFFMLDETGEHDANRPLRSIGDLVTALAERGPEQSVFLVWFGEAPAAGLNTLFRDRA